MPVNSNFTPGQILTAAQLNTQFGAAAAQSDLAQIQNGTATDAGALTGTETVSMSRGAGLLQTVSGNVATLVVSTLTFLIVTATGAVRRSIIGKLLDMPLTPQDFGAKGDYVTDDSAAIQACITAIAARGYGRMRVYAQHICNSVITAPDGVKMEIEMETGAILNFTGAANVVDGVIVIGTDTGGLTALPTIGSAVTKGDATTTFASAPALNQGDLYILCNTTAYSWLSVTTPTARPYYLSGEYCRVRSVSGAVVTNEQRAFDSYAVGSNISAWKVTPSTVRIHGKGQFIFAPNTSATTAQINSGIIIYNGYKCEISGPIATGANRANIDLRRCYSTRINDVVINDYSADVSLNYGVSMIACFDTHVSRCSTHTTRHGVTITGGSITGSIPNRMCTVNGSTLVSDYLALDMHGASEHCSFIDNLVYGGVDIAGDNSTVRGGKIFTSYNTAGQVGCGIRVREILGANHTIEDVEIIVMDAVVAGTDAPIALNLADQYSATTGLRGGEIRISNVTIRSNVAITIAARVSIPATSLGNVKVSIDGVTCIRPSGTTSPQFSVSSVAGGYYDEVLFKNTDGVAAYMSGISASRITIDGVDVTNAPTHGVYVSVQAASFPQLIDVKNTKSVANQQGGLVFIGPGTSNGTVIATVDGGASYNNNQSGTSTTRYKSSVSFESLTLGIVTGMRVGDMQSTATQSYTVSGLNCTTVVESANPQMVSALGHLNSGVTTWSSTIPAL